VSISEYLANPQAGAHWLELACWRYSVEAEALAGHERIVKEWAEGPEDET
jgi:hypothetical protein